MQPSFLPWIGFFDMADLSENIVFLNDVDYSKNSWHNRNQIRTENGLEWITIPIEKKFTVSKKLVDIKIITQDIKFKKISNTIFFKYKKAKFFKNYSEEFFTLFKEKFFKGNLSELNISIIKWALKRLQIKAKFHFSHEMKLEGKRTDKIINICKFIKCENYLSTPGSLDYLKNDVEKLSKNNL